jgi:hypothetical protein
MQVALHVPWALVHVFGKRFVVDRYEYQYLSAIFEVTGVGLWLFCLSYSLPVTLILIRLWI